MAIGTPTQLCIVANSVSGAHVATAVDAPSGSLIVVFVAAWSSNNGTVTAVTDSAGNTYSLAVQHAASASASYPAAIYYCANTANDLPSGGWIAATNSGAVTQGLYACSVSGANAGVDATGNTGSNGSSVT